MSAYLRLRKYLLPILGQTEKRFKEFRKTITKLPTEHTKKVKEEALTLYFATL